jgi:hypothetical protein
MPIPSRINMSGQLRLVRRWTIAVAVLYAVAAVALVFVAALHQASAPIAGRADAAISRGD